MNPKIKLFIAVIFLLSLPVVTLNCQIKVDVKKKVVNQTNNRANKNADQGISKGLDAAENGIKGIFKKKDNSGNDQKSDTASKSGDNKGQASENKSAKEEKTQLQAFSKYDFVPGDQVLLYEDFSQDAVGDFPMLWTTDVAGEINSLNIAPGNWFNLNSTEGTYWFMKDIDFPKNFILEMDIVPKATGGRIAANLVFFGEASHSEMDKNGNPGTCGLQIEMEKAQWLTRGYTKGNSTFLTGSSTINPVEPEKVNHVIVWVQNRRVRVYHKGAKVLDIPTNIYDGSKFTRFCFKLYRGASCGSYISNIKITNAAPDMRSKLLTEGKLVSYGIYFDVNKDVVKPESYGTLKEIAAVLTENPDVRIKIVGYTDSDGADASNLDLSKRRGASVKNELVKTFGIDASRLESDGLGENQPVAPNDTPSNKALNRRVEFIKL
jgi:OmpA-OmpF porin, OOP family